MKARIKFKYNGRHSGVNQGDYGTVDGYCRGGDDIPYAAVILDKNHNFVMAEFDTLEFVGWDLGD